jgi:aspartate/glutamate racemase
LFAKGAQAVVLGCTELSLLGINDAGYIDALTETAKEAVFLCSDKGVTDHAEPDTVS